MRARSSLAAVCADVALCAAALVLGARCAPPAADQGLATTGAPSTEEVTALVNALVVAPPQHGADYDRAAFPHWIEVTPGCDARCAVLDRQRAAAGWWSAYDGYVASDPAELEIDHVVPLAEAWVSGASTWTPARREAFANDLPSPELLAVSAWSNRAKGADDPARWRPPDPSWWCAYAAAWATVKARWELTADAAEIDALRDMAQRC